MKKEKLLIIIFLLLITLVNAVLYTHLKYTFYGDSALPLVNNNIVANFFVWQSNNYSGLISELSASVSIAIWYALFNIINALAGYKIGLTILFWIPYAIFAVGIFYFVIECMRGYNDRLRYFSGFLAVIISTMQIESYLGQMYLILFWPWILLFSLKLFRRFQKGYMDLRYMQ